MFNEQQLQMLLFDKYESFKKLEFSFELNLRFIFVKLHVLYLSYTESRPWPLDRIYLRYRISRDDNFYQSDAYNIL